MVEILREADKTSVAAAAKRHKVSEQTIYAWRHHFAGLEPNDVKNLKLLESESAKLKKLVAGQYPRYGYRRIPLFLGREGHGMSASKAERLWCKARADLPAIGPWSKCLARLNC